METRTLLEKSVAGRMLRVQLGPRDGRLVVSIGVHRIVDGRGVWANVDCRDLPDILTALDEAADIALGD